VTHVREGASYQRPTIHDYGDLVALTAACVGSGSLDESLKGGDDPFNFNSPAFGDSDFCIQ
jgi:hypothetical protein